MHIKAMAVAGATVAALAVSVSLWADHWLKSRLFKPIDMPVVLNGQIIRTEPFDINLRETYSVYVGVDLSIDDYYEDRCNYKSLWGPHWNAYRQSDGEPSNTRVWATSQDQNQNGRDSGEFYAEPGKYRVEWQSPAQAACLNKRHPRLSVRTDSTPYEQAFGAIQNACLLFEAVGAGALLRAIALWLGNFFRSKHSLRILPEIPLRNVISLQRHRPMPLIRVLPDFRIAWFCIIGVLTALFCLFVSGWGLQSNGLLVNFRGERATAVQSPFPETMAVYVDARRKFYVNGKVVARQDLGREVEKELARRGVWTVYFEADNDSLYMDAIYAMDTIQGLGAKVIWITPKTRENWKKKSSF